MHYKSWASIAVRFLIIINDRATVTLETESRTLTRELETSDSQNSIRSCSWSKKMVLSHLSLSTVVLEKSFQFFFSFVRSRHLMGITMWLNHNMQLEMIIMERKILEQKPELYSSFHLNLRLLLQTIYIYIMFSKISGHPERLCKSISGWPDLQISPTGLVRQR